MLFVVPVQLRDVGVRDTDCRNAGLEAIKILSLLPCELRCSDSRFRGDMNYSD